MQADRSGANAPGAGAPASDEAPTAGVDRGPKGNTQRDCAAELDDCASDWHRVGAGLRCRFLLDAAAGSIECQWRPRMPRRDELPRIWAGYLRARDDFTRALARRLGGGPALVVER